MEEVTIYRFQLEEIADALRMTANIYDCREQKTCFDRTVAQAEQFALNALKGEKDTKVQYGIKTK